MKATLDALDERLRRLLAQPCGRAARIACAALVLLGFAGVMMTRSLALGHHAATAVMMCLPLAAMVFLLCPLGLTGKIIVCAVLVVPAGGFALLGVQDNSLLTFARLYSRWRKNRRILIYRGTQWIHANQKKNKKGSI